MQSFKGSDSLRKRDPVARSESVLADPRLSVVIITKNESEIIETCLKSVFSQSAGPLEVLVVDGRSTDDTIEKAKKFEVKVIPESGRTSPANARNLGVEKANGDIVLIMGADAELDKDCIKNAIEYFKKPDVLVVVPSLEIRIHTRLEEIQAKWFYGTRSRFRTKHGTGSSIQFIRKVVYQSVKFDSSLGLGDDSDFRRRLVKLQGGNRGIITASDSRIFVNLPHTMPELRSQYFWYGRTLPKYFARYHSIGNILSLGNILLPSVFAVTCLATLLFLPAVSISFFILLLVLTRNIVVCIRSRSSHFLEFVFFDFTRSLLYAYGLAQSFFIRRTGR